MTIGTVFRTAALGAAAMYLFDPDRGRRRRAIARDKLRSAVQRTSTFVEAARRDARHRIDGLGAKTHRLALRDDTPSNDVLVERVRARLGRVVSHPHAIRVVADSGRVRLIGPILAREHMPLIAAIRLVRGVREIDDEALALHERPDGISALQGESTRPGLKPEFLQDNWTPALRLAAILGGGALALYALGARGLSRIAFSTTGLALVARGATNTPLRRLLNVEQPRDTAGYAGARTAANQEDAEDDWTRTAPAGPPAAQPGLQ